MKSQHLLCLLALALLLVACQPKPKAEEESESPQLYIRKNAHSQAAQADIDALRVAIAKMKQLDCTDPTSWYYQGAIHHIPDTINGRNVLCSNYQGKSNSLPGFSTCPHMKPDLEQFHFLTWHRLYIWYWERIVRHHSGKADFALPYWNYNDPDQRTLPEKYRLPASYAENPIYEMDRSRILLEGLPIQPSDSDGIVMNIDDKIVQICKQSMAAALDTVPLWEARDIHLFSVELEDGTHNVIHDYVGGAVDKQDLTPPIENRVYQVTADSVQGLMADVPSAGFDPIFFAHHANIDRLWMNWELDHPDKALTWEDFQKAGPWSYIFFLPDGTKVEYTSMQQVFDSIRAIDYTYDYLLNRPAVEAEIEVKPIAVGNELLRLNTNQPLIDPLDMIEFELPEAPANQSGYYSMEATFSFDRPHNTHIAVLLRSTAQPDSTALCEKHVVGVAGFFGASLHDHGGGSHDHHMPHSNKITKTIKYDITDELREVAAPGSRKYFAHFHLLGASKRPQIYLENVVIKFHSS
ncbi:MAG TPA: tyrosinase family protein [Saprospiraceae bacterium]|nr:tyrosinase family protein [Saprospiraceae bacterium]HMQ84468.1 tyrosinase family protein [Saprospiraceae bacterium]